MRCKGEKTLLGSNERFNSSCGTIEAFSENGHLICAGNLYARAKFSFAQRFDALLEALQSTGNASDNGVHRHRDPQGDSNQGGNNGPATRRRVTQNANGNPAAIDKTL